MAKVPMIDLRNAATCLACPLADCVYETEDVDVRQLCPIWRREAKTRTDTAKRYYHRRKAVEAEAAV
jgi:hypothetical protein